MATRGNLIPVHGEFLADTETPVSAYLKIKNKDFSYLLESADGGTVWGAVQFYRLPPHGGGTVQEPANGNCKRY